MSYFDAAITQMNGNYGDLIKISLPEEIDYKTVLAIFAVESPGAPFGASGKPIIRVELHWFWDLYGKNCQDKFFQFFNFDSGKRWQGHVYRNNPRGPYVTLHTTAPDQQAREYEALDIIARNFGQQAVEMALRGTSVGMGQIMGFHYGILGYHSAGEMHLASHSLSVQIADFIKFILHDPRLVGAIDKRDWEGFARIYNGSGQVPIYSKRLSDAYAAATRVVKNA